jgi:hypothetical protein
MFGLFAAFQVASIPMAIMLGIMECHGAPDPLTIRRISACCQATAAPSPGSAARSDGDAPRDDWHASRWNRERTPPRCPGHPTISPPYSSRRRGHPRRHVSQQEVIREQRSGKTLLPDLLEQRREPSTLRARAQCHAPEEVLCLSNRRSRQEHTPGRPSYQGNLA